MRRPGRSSKDLTIAQRARIARLFTRPLLLCCAPALLAGLVVTWLIEVPLNSRLRLEGWRFIALIAPADTPVNTLGIRRLMFAVDALDAMVARLRSLGAEVIGEMEYEGTYRLAYIRGPEGIIVALAEQLGRGS